MRVARNGSVDPFSMLRREMNQWLHAFDRGAATSSMSHGAFPALNVWEAGEAYHIEAELPGLKLEDLDISVLSNELTLSGSYPNSGPEGAKYSHRERGVGSFKRVLRLPSDVDAEKVEATLAAGVLTLVLPKAEAAKARKIEVKRA